MAVPNPYQQYRRQQINTSSQDKLLILLYDGAIRFCRQAQKSIEDRNLEMAHTNLVKAENIILELMSSLNMDFAIAQNLYSLYDYLYRRLAEANMKKDPAIIDEALGFLAELRKTWVEAMLKAKSEGMVSFEGKYLEPGSAADGRGL